MERITRTSTPTCLTDLRAGKVIYKTKGIRWSNKYIGNNSSAFSWGTHQSRSLNHILVEDLQSMSESHCFYCDKKNIIKGIITPTIDHFIPKTIKPLLAYFWNNLFLCCTECQNYKKEDYSKDLLKFDRVNFNFDDYFIIDFSTGIIEVRPGISIDEQNKAKYTLDKLGINKDARPSARIEEVNAFCKSINNNYDDFSYRFYLTRSVCPQTI